jgi:hypothetical protein
MKNYKILFHVLIGFLIMGIITTTSCRKPKSPKAVVTVIDENDYKVEGAMVVVFVDKNGAMIDPSAGIVSDTSYTESGGTVEYEFKNEAIFDVYVEKEIDGVLKTGEGILILKNDELEEETVVIK